MYARCEIRDNYTHQSQLLAILRGEQNNGCKVSSLTNCHNLVLFIFTEAMEVQRRKCTAGAFLPYFILYDETERKCCIHPTLSASILKEASMLYAVIQKGMK